MKLSIQLVLILLFSFSIALAKENVKSDKTTVLSVEHIALSKDKVVKDVLEGTKKYPYVWYYETKVTNNSKVPLKIIWFEAYSEHESSWFSNNILGRTMRNKEFVAWYNDSKNISNTGWLLPGKTALCAVNWHYSLTPKQTKMKWSYIAIDSKGNDYFIEKIVPSFNPVKN